MISQNRIIRQAFIHFQKSSTFPSRCVMGAGSAPPILIAAEAPIKAKATLNMRHF
ncbi:MAG TPA: hypothetical protein VIG66_03050 [Noviherbaspirillum sp.]